MFNDVHISIRENTFRLITEKHIATKISMETTDIGSDEVKGQIQADTSSAMTQSITSLDFRDRASSMSSIVDHVDGGDYVDGARLSRPAAYSPSYNRNSKVEWEYSAEKTSNITKDLKKSPELNSKKCIYVLMTSAVIELSYR